MNFMNFIPFIIKFIKFKPIIKFKKFERTTTPSSLVTRQQTTTVDISIRSLCAIMFSMFGRTGAPTKRGTHKRTGRFLQHSNMPQIIEISSVGRYSYILGRGPTFFSEQGTA